MKRTNWKKIIVLYFFILFITILLFFPIDLLIYRNFKINYFGEYLLHNFVIVSILIFISGLAVLYFNNKLWIKKIILRISLEIVFAFFLVNSIRFLFQYFFLIRFTLQDFIFLSFRDKSFFVSSIEGAFIILIIETIYLYYKRKESEMDNNKFKYLQLKNQINPHFLFNSLNILLAMVYKRNPKESANFIEKLSDVYRYVLSNNYKNIVSIEEEIDFISKYGEILKTRFNDGFSLNIDVRKKDINKKILLMSLQLLVENAVKHNIACEEKPLIIDIFSDNNSIIISNTKNKRSTKVISTGIGLKNLNERYRIVANKDIKVIDEDHFFKVIIPLI
ncbi:MAG: sensor histidine kinase [Bacteroidales bacterium]|nr:sensor histidine kinase [Bacteroidales bacterium]